MANKEIKVLSSPDSNKKSEINSPKSKHLYDSFQNVLIENLCYEIEFEKHQNYLEVLWKNLLLVKVQQQGEFCSLTTFVQPQPQIHQAIATKCFNPQNIQNIEYLSSDIAKVIISTATIEQIFSYLDQLCQVMRNY